MNKTSCAQNALRISDVDHSSSIYVNYLAATKTGLAILRCPYFLIVQCAPFCLFFFALRLTCFTVRPLYNIKGGLEHMNTQGAIHFFFGNWFKHEVLNS